MAKALKARATRLPTGQTPLPVPPRYEVVDLALRQHAQRLNLGLLEFCSLAREALEGKYYERFGYPDPEPYFADRIGIAYRTVRRRLGILEGVLRLPPAEQEEAKRALSALGAHKAAEVARVMGKRDGWRDLVDKAARMTTDALREEVSDRLEAKPRGVASEPGARFLRFVLAQMPPDVQAHVEAVFAGLMRHFELTSPVSAFLVLVDLGHAELAAHGKVDIDQDHL